MRGTLGGRIRRNEGDCHPYRAAGYPICTAGEVWSRDRGYPAAMTDAVVEDRAEHPTADSDLALLEGGLVPDVDWSLLT